MAEQQITQLHRPHGQQLHGGEAGTKGLLDSKGGPSSSQVVAVATLFPVGGILLTLAGLTLTATVVGLALVTPLFVVFSPVLVPAAAVIGLALLGFLTAGVLGVGALSAFSWIVMNYVRQKGAPEHYVELARRRGQEAAGYVGHRTKDVGQAIQEGAGGGRSST